MSHRHYYGRVDPDLTIWPTKPHQSKTGQSVHFTYEVLELILQQVPRKEPIT